MEESILPTKNDSMEYSHIWMDGISLNWALIETSFLEIKGYYTSNQLKDSE